jgi:hypothetical protein
LLGPALWAQVPAGPAFQVNTYTTARQAYPKITMRPHGDFVVVWDFRVGYTVNEVQARWFGANGAPAAGEFRVNAYTTGFQGVSAGGGIGLDGRGNAIAVWSDFRSGSSDVFARRVPAGGVAVGDDFRLNQTTAGSQGRGSIARAPDGRFVVVWQDLNSYDIFGRRFDASGGAQGAEFRVNTYTTGQQVSTDVAIDAAGNFTVTWHSYGQDAPVQAGVFAQRFSAGGAPVGGEFQVNTHSTGNQFVPSIAMNRDGDFVVAWEGEGPGGAQSVWARRFARTGAPLGAELAITTAPPGGAAQGVEVAIDEAGHFVAAWGHFFPGPTPFERVHVRRFSASGVPRGVQFEVAAPTGFFPDPRVAADAVGNFVVTWQDAGVDDREVFARRFGGLFPAALAVVDGGNGVLEVSESFSLTTSWRNFTGIGQEFFGASSTAVAPPGLALTLTPSASYGPVLNGAVGSCTVCFSGSLTGTRPAGHVDATFLETIQPEVQGQAKRWALHVGQSFTDVPLTSGSYSFVETLLHRGVTAGCGPSLYCPAASTTREQMAVFLLLAKEAAEYAPPACTTPVFADVPASSPFCPWVEELARRSVTGGCGGGNYCPSAAVSREQMSVFLLRTLDPTLNPPACATPMFNDVPASSPFCRWIEELARRGITGGCGGGNFCPTQPVTREQMAVFLTGTFGLTLYGP